MADRSESGREHLRFDATIPVRFADQEEFLTEYTKNISMGGVFVRMAEPAVYGSIVNLVLEPPNSDVRIQVTGKVVFVVEPEAAAREGKEPGIGVRFQQLTDEAREALAGCVRRLSEGTQGRILLVDGDADHTQQLSGVLRDMSFNVVTVASAVKGLDVLWREPFDLILTAVTMTRMDGFEFRDTLLRDPDAASIPFVFLSNDESEEDAEVAGKLHVKYYLRKPVSRESLEKILGELITPTLADSRPAAPRTKTKSATHQQRINEISYKKLRQLGIPARFTADERAVIAELELQSVRILDVFTKQPIAKLILENVTHDKIRVVEPALLSNLQPIPILDLPDRAALERAIETEFNRHRRVQGFGTELLKKWGITPEFDQERFCVVGRIAIGRNEITFTFLNTETLLIDGLNGTLLPEGRALNERSVAADKIDSALDVEGAINEALLRHGMRLHELLSEEAAAAAAAESARVASAPAQVVESSPSAPDDHTPTVPTPVMPPEAQPAPAGPTPVDTETPVLPIPILTPAPDKPPPAKPPGPIPVVSAAAEPIGPGPAAVRAKPQPPAAEPPAAAPAPPNGADGAVAPPPPPSTPAASASVPPPPATVEGVAVSSTPPPAPSDLPPMFDEPAPADLPPMFEAAAPADPPPTFEATAPADPPPVQEAPAPPPSGPQEAFFSGEDLDLGASDDVAELELDGDADGAGAPSAEEQVREFLLGDAPALDAGSDSLELDDAALGGGDAPELASVPAGPPPAADPQADLWEPPADPAMQPPPAPQPASATQPASADPPASTAPAGDAGAAGPGEPQVLDPARAVPAEEPDTTAGMFRCTTCGKSYDLDDDVDDDRLLMQCPDCVG